MAAVEKRVRHFGVRLTDDEREQLKRAGVGSERARELILQAAQKAGAQIPPLPPAAGGGEPSALVVAGTNEDSEP